MIEAVVFDLDDTLYHERSFAFSGFAAVSVGFAEALGPARASARRMRELFDTDARGRVFDTVLAEARYPDPLVEEKDGEVIRRMILVYCSHSPSIMLCEDADKVLTRLNGKMKLGLITDGPVEMQRCKIEALKLEARMDHVILTGELGPGRGKPDPVSFEMIARELGVSHSQCVYVADNVSKDFVAPNQLGWRSIRIARPLGVYRNAPTAEGGEPHRTIATLDELDRLIEFVP